MNKKVKIIQIRHEPCKKRSIITLISRYQFSSMSHKNTKENRLEKGMNVIKIHEVCYFYGLTFFYIYTQKTFYKNVAKRAKIQIQQLTK